MEVSSGDVLPQQQRANHIWLSAPFLTSFLCGWRYFTFIDPYNMCGVCVCESQQFLPTLTFEQYRQDSLKIEIGLPKTKDPTKEILHFSCL